MRSDLRWVFFTFLIVSTGGQLTSFLSSFMVINTLSVYFHDGIFWRCGALHYLGISRDKTKATHGQEQIHVYANKPISQQYLDSFILSNFRPKQEKQWFREMPGVCYWWDRHVFATDEKTMQAVVILSFISCGVLSLVFILFVASLFQRFKSYKTDYTIASLLLLNLSLLAAILVCYTIFINGHKQLTDDQMPASPIVLTISLLPLYFSWSYWVLFATAGGNLIAALILFAFSKPENHFYDQVYTGYMK